MLTWCCFVFVCFGENRQPCLEFSALKRNSLRSVLDCVGPCLEESLLSLAKLRLKSGRVSLSTLNVWMFGSRTTVKKVRNLLTWFSHGSGAILAQSLWGEFLFLPQECLRLCSL